MNNKILLSVLFILFTCPLFAQHKMTTEEMAVKKVIEDETHWFNQRDYDKWAACVAHDEMTYFTWTSPFHGENGRFEAKGWEAVSRQYKKFLEEWPVNDEDQEKVNYKFKIGADMAYVSFTQRENDNEGIRILEKRDGQWKILRMEALASRSFDNFHKLYALQRMCGEWNIDPSTIEKEGGGNWTLLGGSVHIKPTGAGIKAISTMRFKNGDGDIRNSEEYDIISLNMETGKIGLFHTATYPYSGWCAAASGAGDLNDDGMLVFVGSGIGEKSKDKGKMGLTPEGILSWHMVSYDENDQKVFEGSYLLRPSGAYAATP